MTLIVALIMSYLVCWTPLHLFHLLTAFEYRMNMDACTAFEHVYNGWVHFLNLTAMHENGYILAWYGSTQHWIQFFILFLVTDSKWNSTKLLTKWDGFYRPKVTNCHFDDILIFWWHNFDIFQGNIHSIQNGLHNSKLSHLYSFSQRNLY